MKPTRHLPSPVALALAIALPAASVASAASLVGLWEFKDPSNLALATIGEDLTVTGAVSTTTGVSALDPAIELPKASWLSVPNAAGPNGASGTPTRTNQFTLVLDFKMPVFQGTGNGVFSALFDFDFGTGDADYFIRKQANQPELGVASIWNYVGAGSTVTADPVAGTVLADTWYRLALAADNGVAGSSAVYLDGVKIGDHATGSIDALRRSLGAAFRVGWDNDNETSDMVISNLALYDGRLDDSAILALGGAGSVIPEPTTSLLGALGALALLRRRR